MIMAETFRMGGHATHDEREARRMLDPELFETWGRRDPVGMYEEYLVGLGRPLVPSDGQVAGNGANTEEWNRAVLQRIETETLQEVDTAEEEALRSLETSIPEAGPGERLDCYA